MEKNAVGGSRQKRGEGKNNALLQAEQFLIDPKINLKNLQLPKDSIHFPDIF
jgi:hypothetical protein